MTDTIILKVPDGTKARWVRQSQAQGKKLSDWVRVAVDRPANTTTPSPCARCGAVILVDDWQAEERRQAEERMFARQEQDRDRMQALEESLQLMRHRLEDLQEQRDQAREDLARAESETRKAYEQLRAVERACAEELKKHRAS